MTNNEFMQDLDHLLLHIDAMPAEELIARDLTNYNINDIGSISRLYHYLNNQYPNIKEYVISKLSQKGNEYSEADDRFINFRRGYELNLNLFDTYALSPRKVLYILASKHVVWCIDYMNGKVRADADLILEHFGDVLNYLLLDYIGGEELE